MSDVGEWLDRTQAITDQAHRHIGRICSGRDRWTMSIPARDTDSDMLLTRLAMDHENAVAALRAVTELHRRMMPDAELWPNLVTCGECLDDMGDHAPYPCPTITAITETIGGHP